MNTYRIYTSDTEHIKSLVNDYIKDGWVLVYNHTTTAILTKENSEIRIDLI